MHTDYAQIIHISHAINSVPPDIFKISMFFNCSPLSLIFIFYIEIKIYLQLLTAPSFTCTDLKVNIATYLVSNKMTETSYLYFLRNTGIT